MRFAIVCIGMAVVSAVNSAELRVSVADSRAQPILDSVVVVVPLTPQNIKSDSVIAVMDQKEKHFVPEVLIVRTGTAVSFPNSDSVAHQVYSFSAAKRFALPLYRGKAHPPLIFEQPGVVVVGCNIHDQMIGYVYVTDAPFFGKTDAKGQLVFNALSPGGYRVTVWHSRFDEPVPNQEVRLGDTEAGQVVFRTQRALRPKPQASESRVRDY